MTRTHEMLITGIKMVRKRDIINMPDPGFRP